MKSSKKAVNTPAAAAVDAAQPPPSPPGRIELTIAWPVKCRTPADGRGLRATVALRIPAAATAVVRVERKRVLKVEDGIGAGAEPDLQLVLRRLGLVAEALRGGTADVVQVAKACGFVVVAQEDTTWPTPAHPRPTDPEVAGLEFRRVPDWTSYEVSRGGVIHSYHDIQNKTTSATPQRVLRPKIDPGGVATVSLSHGRYGTPGYRKREFTVAEVVAMAWGDLPPGPTRGGPTAAGVRAARPRKRRPPVSAPELFDSEDDCWREHD